MILTEVRNRAQQMGIDIGNKGMAELVHLIQTKEGNSPCFGWSGGYCSHKDCCWQSDCLGKIGIIKALHIIEIVE
jgi:hypothetical protein